MRRKVTIYPFCPELLPAVKMFEEFQNEYAIKYLVSPNGFGYTGKDAGYVCNQKNIGIKVLNNIPFDVMDWDTLILYIPVLKRGDFFEKDILRQAAISGRHTICVCTAKEILSEEIVKELQNYSESIEVICYPQLQVENGDQRLHEPEVPVALVGGILEEADCFETFLRLAEKMQKERWNIVAFSKHPIGSLFGFYSLEHIWNCNAYSETEKVLRVNYYINDVIKKSGASMVLIEAPDALMRYNDFTINNFGIRTYMLCQTVTPDYFIGCIPFDLVDKNMVGMLNKNFEYRLGRGFDAMHISNVLLDAFNTMQRVQVELLYADMKFVEQRIKEKCKYRDVLMVNVVENGIESIYEAMQERDSTRE